MSTNTNQQIGLKTNPGDSAGGVVGQTKEFGRDMKEQADSFTQAASEAVKTQVESLAGQAKEVTSEAGEKVRASMNEQKAAGADYVSNIAGVIRRAAAEFDNDIPQAGQYIRKAAEQLDGVSDAIRQRNMSEIVSNVQDFARRQPTAFLGAAMLFGFAAVRFLKSSSSQGGTNHSTSANSHNPGHGPGHAS